MPLGARGEAVDGGEAMDRGRALNPGRALTLRESVTVRMPPLTLDATNATEGARIFPGPWLASLRSVTSPSPSTMIAYGESFIVLAANPTPNLVRAIRVRVRLLARVSSGDSYTHGGKRRKVG